MRPGLVLPRPFVSMLYRKIQQSKALELLTYADVERRFRSKAQYIVPLRGGGYREFAVEF